MRKLLALFGILAVIGCGSSDKKEKEITEGATLEQRLADYMKYTDEMNMDKMLDYIYPKLFTIAPRKQLQKLMEDAYNSEEVSVTLDSLKLEKIHPVFQMEGGSYAKVDYSMLMIMKLKDPGEESPYELLLAGFEEEFGKGNVRYDDTNGSFRVQQKSTSIAVKDKYAKEWSFAELNKDDDVMLKKLFSKEVLEKIDSFN